MRWRRERLPDLDLT